jgi:hypothetical protein
MSATRSYAPPNVDDPSAPPRRPRPTDPAAPPTDERAVAEEESVGRSSDLIDLSGLPVIGITRRRVGWASATFVAIWIVIVFARQIGDAQTAANQATQLAADNAALSAEVAALEHEAEMVIRPDYVGLESRAHQFGKPKEIPFTLDPSVAAPVDGAPGSASVRLGAAADRQTPIESWLSLLFGPSD